MPLSTLSAHYTDPHRYPEGVAFQDDQFIRVADAKISVLDWGFLHSDATYDTVHVWDGGFFRLDAHLDRFFAGLDKLRMSVPYDRQEVAEILNRCVALSGLRAAYVEMICTRGTSPGFSRDPRDAENRFIAFAVPFGSIATPSQMDQGLHLCISDVLRIPPSSVDPTIKNYHWLDLVRGQFDAFDRAADTALLRASDGSVSEGPGFNLFVVDHGGVRTPEAGVLPGITRRTVFELCDRLGIEASAGSVFPADLERADEIFVTSTAGGIVPVTMIGQRPVGTGRVGDMTRRLTALYWDTHRDPAWHTPVLYAETDAT